MHFASHSFFFPLSMVDAIAVISLLSGFTLYFTRFAMGTFSIYFFSLLSTSPLSSSSAYVIPVWARLPGTSAWGTGWISRAFPTLALPDVSFCAPYYFRSCGDAILAACAFFVPVVTRRPDLCPFVLTPVLFRRNCANSFFCCCCFFCPVWLDYLLFAFCAVVPYAGFWFRVSDPCSYVYLHDR